MRPNIELAKIYLHRDPIDFRKAHRGLVAIIEMELGHNPFDGYLYAFTNRQRNKIKCIFWEENGFVLYYKSLSEEKFKWPKKTNSTVDLNRSTVELVARWIRCNEHETASKTIVRIVVLTQTKAS